MIDPSEVDKEELLKEIKGFIDNSNKFINDACNYFGWDLEKIKEKHERYITCPFDEGHWMPKESLEKHLLSCEWKALGYTKECVPLTESTLPPDNPSSLKFDAELQQKVFSEAHQKNPVANISVTERFAPQTSDRLFSDFTTDERRVMYDYVIANTVAPDIGKDIADLSNPPQTSGDKQSKTMVELLAQERNLKRRRAKYKGVHTNKKSHTEILREIIEQQLEMFKEHIAEKTGATFSGDPKNTEDRNVFSEKKSLRAQEDSKNDSRQDRFHDQNPSPRHEQLDRRRDDNNSHRDQCSKSSQGHQSRDRHRHYHSNDDDYKDSQRSKYGSRFDESHSRERNDSRHSRDDSNGRSKHEKYEKEHKSHRREEKHDKHKHAKHKHRSRSRSHGKSKKKDKKRDRSRSRNKDRKRHRSNSRSRSP